MREIKYIVVHCTATRCTQDYTEDQMLHDHRLRHFAGIGYHWYIRKDGREILTRPEGRIGAHARGWNESSIGVCYEGGLDKDGHPADTRTPAQKKALDHLLRGLLRRNKKAIIIGHGQLPRVQKACPCFNAVKEYTPLMAEPYGSEAAFWREIESRRLPFKLAPLYFNA